MHTYICECIQQHEVKQKQTLPHEFIEGSFREASILSGDVLLVPRATLRRHTSDPLQHLFLQEKKRKKKENPALL